MDTERFSPRRRHAPVRRRFLDGGDTLLLSVGRVSPEKRLDVLLEAFAQARAIRDGLRLVVAGDGPAREELERRAPEGVRFVGEIRGVDLARLYASADVFCFPSTTDTFGQVLVEAGAAGLPVVAARAGGAPELVADWRTGLLVPRDDAPAFAGALLALADDPERRAEMGAAGRTAALERSWERSLGELRARVPRRRRRPRSPALESWFFERGKPGFSRLPLLFQGLTGVAATPSMAASPMPGFDEPAQPARRRRPAEPASGCADEG